MHGTQPLARAKRPKDVNWRKSTQEPTSEPLSSPQAINIGVGHVDYIDCIRVRLYRRYWFDPIVLKKVRPLCASATWQEGKFGNYYLNITQPTDKCIRYLCQLQAKLFYAEIARDYYDRTGELLQTFRRHCVHRWKRTPSRQFKQTEYGGARHSESQLVYYEKNSKKLDALACHTEYRIRGARALRGANIHSLRDLLRFDYDKFWTKRLCLRGVDRQRLASSLGSDVREVRLLLQRHFRKTGHVVIELKDILKAGRDRDYCMPELLLQWNGCEHTVVRKRQLKRQYYDEFNDCLIDNNDASSLIV